MLKAHLRLEGIKDGFEAVKTNWASTTARPAPRLSPGQAWNGWRRHVALVMLAFAMVAAIRRQANTAAPQKSSLRMIRKNRH